MAVETDPQEKPAGRLDEFRAELSALARHLPDKGLFVVLLVLWSALFHFWGNSVFGWIDTPSMFRWAYFVIDTSPDDELGKLVPFIVLGLFWWKRKELMAVRTAIWWPALGLVILALGLHVAGFLVQQTRVSVLAFFLGVYGLMGLLWGRGWMGATFFPMFLFLFCIPVGSAGMDLTFPLRVLATKITGAVCGDGLGIRLIVDGTQLIDPTGRFKYEVAAACGGIRSLAVMLGLATIYGFVAFSSPWKRMAIIASAVPLAIAGNVFRLVGIVVAAEAFGNDAGNFVHDKLSLLPYIPAIVGLMLLGYWLKEDRRDEPLGMAVATNES